MLKDIAFRKKAETTETLMINANDSQLCL